MNSSKNLEAEGLSSKTARSLRRGRVRRAIALGALALAVAAAVTFGLRTLAFYRHNVETDDAEVEGHIDPVLPRVSGYVTEVDVKDNQRVDAGQVLVKIDTRDLQAKSDLALAALSNARAQVAVATANVKAAETGRVKSAADLQRFAALRRKEEISQQQYDAAVAAAEEAAAQHEASRRQVAAAIAQVAQKQADLDYSRLQLSYATVVSPAAGTVSKKSVEVGELVQAGQPLLAVVEDGDLWVVANFKETQLRKMKVGQPVTIAVDAYPDRKLSGRVDSFSAATGAKFALLPPDNATGNFTRVVQRVPVKIVLSGPPDPAHPLRAGMSVTAVVRID